MTTLDHAALTKAGTADGVTYQPARRVGPYRPQRGFAAAYAKQLEQRARVYASTDAERAAKLLNVAQLIVLRGDDGPQTRAIALARGGRWTPGPHVQEFISGEVLLVPLVAPPPLDDSMQPFGGPGAKRRAEAEAERTARIPDTETLLANLVVAETMDAVELAREEAHELRQQLRGVQPNLRAEEAEKRAAEQQRLAVAAAGRLAEQQHRAEQAESEARTYRGMLRQLATTAGIVNVDGYLDAKVKPTNGNGAAKRIEAPGAPETAEADSEPSQTAPEPGERPDTAPDTPNARSDWSRHSPGIDHCRRKDGSIVYRTKQGRTRKEWNSLEEARAEVRAGEIQREQVGLDARIGTFDRPEPS